MSKRQKLRRKAKALRKAMNERRISDSIFPWEIYFSLPKTERPRTERPKKPFDYGTGPIFFPDHRPRKKGERV